jgi:hypothetical protein
VSRFGVVILSPEFFRKGWTNRELDGLVAREDGKDKVILPIWHNVVIEDVLRFSPMLASKLGVPTSQGVEFVANQILRAIEKEPGYGAPQFDQAPSRDRIAGELSLIRQDMLRANSRWEFCETLFRVEDFLSRYPNHPEARLLRDSIKESMWYHEPPARSAPMPSMPPVSMPLYRFSILRVILGLLLVSGIMAALFFLIRWLLTLLK